MIPRSRAWNPSESIARQPKSYRSWRTLGRRISSARFLRIQQRRSQSWRTLGECILAIKRRTILDSLGRGAGSVWHHQRGNRATMETIQVVENGRPRKARCGSAMIQRPNGAPPEMIWIVEEIGFCRVTSRLTRRRPINYPLDSNATRRSRSTGGYPPFVRHSITVRLFSPNFRSTTEVLFPL